MEFQPEDELCICFHVTPRQLARFLRHEKPRVASQCSECFGAGTGCGWCIPYIEKMFESFEAGNDSPADVGMDWSEYRERRKAYLVKVRMNRMAPKPPDEDAALPEEDRLADEIEP